MEALLINRSYGFSTVRHCCSFRSKLTSESLAVLLAILFKLIYRLLLKAALSRYSPSCCP
jgi:hypothetical protein